MRFIGPAALTALALAVAGCTAPGGPNARDYNWDTGVPGAAAGGKPFTSRKPPDPVLEFLELFKLWVKQGKPADAFMLETQAAPPPAPTEQTYLMPPDLGNNLTNIGNCVPDAPMVAALQ